MRKQNQGFIIQKEGEKMKKVLVAAVVLIFTAGVCFAQKPSGRRALVVAPVVSAEELAAQKKSELNATEWNIEVKAMASKGRGENDVVSFADEKVVSKNLQKQGFNPTSFTVRVQEDGTVTWETMQTSADNGSAFWRGDILNGIMRGVLMRKDKRGNVTDYNFSSLSSQRTVASEPVVVQPVVDAQPIAEE
jgi:hypothetical protein